MLLSFYIRKIIFYPFVIIEDFFICSRVYLYSQDHSRLARPTLQPVCFVDVISYSVLTIFIASSYLISSLPSGKIYGCDYAA